jgi:hypothetical protein
MLEGSSNPDTAPNNPKAGEQNYPRSLAERASGRHRNDRDPECQCRQPVVCPDQADEGSNRQPGSP